jgi:hypothetical protein
VIYLNPPDDGNLPLTYEILVHGKFGDSWVRWLHGLADAAIVLESNPQVTALEVQVQDQAALRGILNQLWDLNLTLVGVRWIQPHLRKEGGYDE